MSVRCAGSAPGVLRGATERRVGRSERDDERPLAAQNVAHRCLPVDSCRDKRGLVPLVPFTLRSAVGLLVSGEQRSAAKAVRATVERGVAIALGSLARLVRVLPL